MMPLSWRFVVYLGYVGDRMNAMCGIGTGARLEEWHGKPEILEFP